MTKQIIIAFILGIIVAVFGFHAYFVYQLREQTAQNTRDLIQIVNFLNQGIGATGNAPIAPSE